MTGSVTVHLQSCDVRVLVDGRVDARPSRVALVALALGGCSLTLDPVERRCVDASDCPDHATPLVCEQGFCIAAEGGASSGPSDSTADLPADPWACLDQPLPPETRGEDGVTVYSGRVVDTITQRPPPDLNLRVCDALDPACAQPLFTDIPTDETGRYEIAFPRGFVGYVEVTSSTTVDQLVWVVPDEIKNQIWSQVPVELITPDIRDSLFDVAGIEQDASAGLIQLVAVDCHGDSAAGVAYSIQPQATGTLGYYLYSLLPAFDEQVTSPGGFGGFVNVPPGLVNVRSTVEALGRQTADQRLLVREGWISAALMTPLQAQVGE